MISNPRVGMRVKFIAPDHLKHYIDFARFHNQMGEIRILPSNENSFSCLVKFDRLIDGHYSRFFILNEFLHDENEYNRMQYALQYL